VKVNSSFTFFLILFDLFLHLCAVFVLDFPSQLPELVFEATFDEENYGPGISYDDKGGGTSTYNCLLY
jgi:hypothetical protein